MDDVRACLCVLHNRDSTEPHSKNAFARETRLCLKALACKFQYFKLSVWCMGLLVHCKWASVAHESVAPSNGSSVPALICRSFRMHSSTASQTSLTSTRPGPEVLFSRDSSRTYPPIGTATLVTRSLQCSSFRSLSFWSNHLSHSALTGFCACVHKKRARSLT